tara:strand:+ start:163 stop:495 length:333 start_codon:yes stop_codon:yes gene_type:complete
MSFFDSKFVRDEIEEITKLQEKIYDKMYSFASMNNEDKIIHIEMLEDLLNRQQVMFTRLKLSNDPQAEDIKNQIMRAARTLGFPENVDLNYVLSKMNDAVGKMKEHLRQN